MTAPAAFGLPLVLIQAFDDHSLSPRTKVVMWHVAKRLDHVEWTPVKLLSIEKDSRLRRSTCSEAISTLLRKGYLDVRPLDRRSREFRLPLTRRPPRPKAKPMPPLEQTTLF